MKHGNPEKHYSYASWTAPSHDNLLMGLLSSDHGELFGEEGYFSHGPIMHEKVFEVPFLEGKLR